MSKIIFTFLFICFFASINNYQVEAANKNNKKILGVNSEQWLINMNNFKDIHFSDNFLDEIKENEASLKLKKDTEYFQKLNSKNDILYKHKNNDLLKMKQGKLKSSYITDLSLNDNDFLKVIEYIPLLNKNYSEKDISKFLPYIALAINSDIKTAELNYYIKNDIEHNIDVEIATLRLYNIIIDSLK